MIRGQKDEPLLPYEYIMTIRQNGGWYIYRDEAIPEADRKIGNNERRLIKSRLNTNRNNFRKRK